MRRSVARLQTWWLRLFVALILADLTLDIAFPYDLALMGIAIGLSLVRPPPSTAEPVELAPPVRGTWVAINSPGTAVPSHGVKAYGQMYAVDLLQPSVDAVTTLGWSLRARRPERYRSFGAPVHAMAPGTVVRARSGQRDHGGRSSWPLIIWMMTIEALLRELGGASRILGNHVIVEHQDGTFAAYAHLRRGSTRVRAGQRVEAGEQLAQIGNTGNTSEPHLHVQVMDRAGPTAAAGIPMHWPQLRLEAGNLDPRWGTGERTSSALATFAPNGQIFEVPDRP